MTTAASLSQTARALAEKKLQASQQESYVLSQTIEEMEAQMAIYRHHNLKRLPTPELPLPYSHPYPANRLPEELFDEHPGLLRVYKKAVRPLVPAWLQVKLFKNTILVIDNGGLGKTIEQLSEIYHVVVWRLEGSLMPFPEKVEAEYLPLAEFNYDICVTRFAELKERDSPLAAVLIDGLIWQTPFFAAADMHVPVVLVFERSTTKDAPPPSWLYSQWRIQQSFLWSFDVLCIDSHSIDYFLEQGWLLAANHTTVAAMERRDRDWWQQQVQSWQKSHRSLMAQSQYLQEQDLDIEYFLGSEAWRRENTLAQQMLHFLLSWRRQLYMRQLLPGFDMPSYAQQHPQRQDLNPVVDYLQRKQPSGPWLRQVIQPNHKANPSPQGVALHIHAYYIDKLPGILHCLSFNKLKPDLFISVRSKGEQELAAEYCANYEAALKKIRIVPNRGRDIGPFLTEFGAELVQNYEIIGHVHTKQSLFHSARDFITAWQDFLLANVLGSPDQPMTDTIVATMQHNPDLGMVYPDDPNLFGWGKNKDYAELLMDAMGLDRSTLPSGGFKFPVGTMFWLRAEALALLMRLELDWDDYPSEPLAADGSILHALERLLGLIPEEIGLRSAVTYTPDVIR